MKSLHTSAALASSSSPRSSAVSFMMVKMGVKSDFWAPITGKMVQFRASLIFSSRLASLAVFPGALSFLMVTSALEVSCWVEL